jgi:hypothetical protein
MKSAINLLLLTFAVLILISNKGGRNQATTGAPFENNSNACANCHGGGNFTPEITFKLIDGNNNIVEAYTPNESYKLEISIKSLSGNPKSYGFQAVIVDEAFNNAGKVLANGVNVRNLTIQNRTYLTQSSPKEDGIFTADWQAPDNKGDLTIYISGIATNGNNNTNGDKAVKQNFTNPKSQTSSTDIATEYVSLLKNTTIFDNIYFNQVVTNIAIFDINGRLMIREKDSKDVLNISQFPSGIYILNYEYNGKIYSNKLIKITL